MYSARPRSAYFIKNKIPCFLSYLLVVINKFLEPNIAFKKDIDNRDCSIGTNNCYVQILLPQVFKPTDIHLLRCLVF